jgi:hypothetical protein
MAKTKKQHAKAKKAAVRAAKAVSKAQKNLAMKVRKHQQVISSMFFPA